MPRDYLLLDVFTDVPFGGNPLAVFLDAHDIPEAEMPLIARELNLPETTFVVGERGDPHHWRVRIFTPAAELPFAGHPTVGTASALVHAGLVPVSGDHVRVTLHEGLGPIPVDVALSGGRVLGATFSAPRAPDIREADASREELGAMLGLSADDILDGAWRPKAVGWETAFHVVPVRGLVAARRARLRLDVWERLLGDTWAKEVYVITSEVEGSGCALHARMFAPGLGIQEDPATGSAAAALAGFLAATGTFGNGPAKWVVEQGIELGRASLIDVEAVVTDGMSANIRVGGRIVVMGSGRMQAYGRYPGPAAA